MGKKVHPIAFRLGNIYTWTSRWFASRRYYRLLLREDILLRRALMAKLKTAGIARVEIERSINRVDITVHVARPGIVIGRGGTGMEELKKFVMKLLNIRPDDKKAPKLEIKVEQVKEPNLDAYLVGQMVADQLVKRYPAKRAIEQAVEKVMAAGARGVKVRLAGRIGGAEIARVQHAQSGVLPLSTVRENIDFAAVPALTRSGYVGVKVWICRKHD